MVQAQSAQTERAELTFKRFILNETRAFAHEPQADLYRVNLLAQMLNRYDVLREAGLGDVAASARVRREFHDIAGRMLELGFEAAEEDIRFDSSGWPVLTEDEASKYISESDAYLHKQALGVAMCTACLAPVVVGAAFEDLLYSDFFIMLGMVGMVMMIALGVYSIATARKPKHEEDVKKGRFSFGKRLRTKLMDLREAMEEKARRRRGKGIAILVGSIIPLFIGAAFTGLWYEDFWTIMGLAGMFVMIGSGVYELVMAKGERKTIKKLLNAKK